MKSFAILWVVILALLMVLMLMSTPAVRNILGVAEISFLLSVPIFLLWMVIRYLASKWSGS